MAAQANNVIIMPDRNPKVNPGSSTTD